MSLILDALNRSQRDLENRDSVPGLETVHPVEAMSSPIKIGIGIVLAIICIAAVTAIWIFTSTSDSAVQEANRVIPSAQPAPLVSPGLQVSTDPSSEPAPAATSSAQVLPVIDNPQQKSSLATAAVETADNSAVAALYQTPKQQQIRAARPQKNDKNLAPDLGGTDQKTERIDIEDVLSRAKAGLANTQLQEHSAPFIAELSQQMKDSIPTIYYSVHDYSSVASRSSVVLNGKQVTAGQSVGGGLRLEEILSDSIVLTIRGTQFRLKALNSWVNL